MWRLSGTALSLMDLIDAGPVVGIMNRGSWPHSSSHVK